MGGTCAREGVVVPVFLECRVPDSLILVCCGWEIWVLSVPCMLHSPSYRCWEYVLGWGSASSAALIQLQAGGLRGALLCWRERGEGGRGALIVQGGCRGGAAGQSRPGGRGERWDGQGSKGERHR